jgi:hypothetical protein
MKTWPWLALCLLAAPAAAQPLAVGDHIEAFTLEDQHGVPRTVDAAVAVVLFSRDMEGGEVLKQALADAPPDLLASRRAVYVADISAMPGIVARMFALPKMKKRPYPILLDRKGQATARLPDIEGSATLIFLDDLAIDRVLYLSDPTQVRQELEPDDGGGD